MNKRYTKKQITEAIAYWEKQLAEGNYKRVDEGISYDSAAREAQAIRDDIDDNVNTPKELFAWAASDTLYVTDPHGNELYDWCKTNIEKVKSYVQEIEWEHGDIGSGALAYEDYFNALIKAVENKDINAASEWLDSPMP